MNISVFGLGYVGVVSSACLARNGHKIIGVDVVQTKLDLINSGQSPIVEAEIGGLVKQAVTAGKLRAIQDAEEAVAATEMAIVCVGTPCRENGRLETQYIESAVMEIGRALRDRETPFLVVLRSTIVPGTMRSLIIPMLEETAQRKLGDGIDVVFHPEFLREGTSMQDFYHPPKIVVGERIEGAADTLMQLYDGIEAPRFLTSLEVAESVKYADNCFHAVKITFANEMGLLFHALGVDSREVMDIFCQDVKLNISPRYLRPGFAFGGSCLPKDLRALLHVARSENVSLPMLENVLASNRDQIERVLTRVIKSGRRHIGFVGLAFKPGTDDLRESPLVELAERLIGKGLQLSIYDRLIQVNRLIGKNKAYIHQVLPHLANLLVDSMDQLGESELILLGHPIATEKIEEFLSLGREVIDLTGANVFPGREQYTTIV